MTDKQINQRIAESCGWTEISSDGVVGKAPGETCNRVMFCPLYCTSLNAMHEAESTLRKNGSEFSRVLLELVSEAAGPGVMYAYGSFAHVHAPARLRAEAFLRALGKWEEVQK